jgi:hypothetical protein
MIFWIDEKQILGRRRDFLIYFDERNNILPISREKFRAICPRFFGLLAAGSERPSNGGAMGKSDKTPRRSSMPGRAIRL